MGHIPTLKMGLLQYKIGKSVWLLSITVYSIFRNERTRLSSHDLESILRVKLNGPPYQLWDANIYTKEYLEAVDPETNKKHERCDLPFHRPLTKPEKEEKKEEEKDKSYIAYYSVLF